MKYDGTRCADARVSWLLILGKKCREGFNRFSLELSLNMRAFTGSCGLLSVFRKSRAPEKCQVFDHPRFFYEVWCENY
jgi:hypothetical protein